jgi:hypothetical protein
MRVKKIDGVKLMGVTAMSLRRMGVAALRNAVQAEVEPITPQRLLKVALVLPVLQMQIVMEREALSAKNRVIGVDLVQPV